MSGVPDYMQVKNLKLAENGQSWNTIQQLSKKGNRN